MRLNYKYFCYLFLGLFIAGCLFILVQRRLREEKIDNINYSSAIREGEAKVKNGMTREEVIKLIGYQPDQIAEREGQTILRWSAIFRQGRLTNIIDRYDGMGYYWVIIVFDEQGKVVENSSGYA